MAKKKQKSKAEQPTFEEAISRLSDVVRQLEEGDLTLDDSLARYEAGIRYLTQCKKILSTAERKIEVLSHFDAEGNPVTQPFDDEEMSMQEKADSRSRRRAARPAARKPADPSSANRPISSDETASGDVDLGGTLF